MGLGRGRARLKSFLVYDDCQVVAACDLDANHLQDAVNMVNDHYQTKDCKGYHDYRELLARDDIDAVMIAVPDHWHALVATEAARHKKDVYGEKPLAKTIAEQQAIVHSVEKNKIIWQTGSWQRSVSNFRKAAEIVRNGLIGEVTHVEVGLPGGHKDFADAEPALLQKLAGLPVPHPPRPGGAGQHAAWNLACSKSRRRNWITIFGSGFQDGAIHSSPAAQGLALELQHRRRPVDGIDRAIIMASRTGVWILTTPVRQKSMATAISRPPTPSGTPAQNTGLTFNIRATSP